MRKHPDPDRINLVVTHMREMAALNPKRRVDMVAMNAPNICGTPGCHAGEAYLGLFSMRRAGIKGLSALPPSTEFYYADVATMFSNYVMHSRTASIYTLSEWAAKYPYLWGGERGKECITLGRYGLSWAEVEMWSDPQAFRQINCVFSPRVIHDWWDAVAARIREEEAR